MATLRKRVDKLSRLQRNTTHILMAELEDGTEVNLSGYFWVVVVLLVLVLGLV